MKKIFAYALIVFSSSFFLSACTKKDSNIDLSLSPTPSSNVNLVVSQALSPSISPNETLVAITTKDGQIIVKLFDKEAPKTVKNFLSKANSGFYNGLTFHRVIADFMAQGGDPKGDGTGGGKQESELNQIPFKKGSLGLARTSDTNKFSNDSQFFICYNDTGCAHLTGDYVNFGTVISGFEVLNQIQQGDKIINLSSYTKWSKNSFPTL